MGVSLEVKLDSNILSFIRENPGSHLRKIKKELSLSMGSVQYQLDRLEKRGLITSSKCGFYRFYFPVGMEDFDKKIIQILSQEKSKLILLFIIKRRNPTQGEIAKEVGIASPSVNWHVQRLIELKIIEEIKDGRYKRYKIIGSHEKWMNAAGFIKNYFPSLWNEWSCRITEFFL
jgi:predicted transcriptional regulator